jgi:hypothetical protein
MSLMASAGRKSVPKTLRIQLGECGRYEVRDGRRLLGTSENELMAIWSAVSVAEEMTKAGRTVRVVADHNGLEVEEFIARPADPEPSFL